VVERSRIAATCVIWPGEERLPKEVAARPAGNTGSSLLLNVPQERVAQLSWSSIRPHYTRRIMAIDLSRYYVTVEILTHVDITFPLKINSEITTRGLADISWDTLYNTLFQKYNNNNNNNNNRNDIPFLTNGFIIVRHYATVIQLQAT
jgi:hypothetical protein